MNTMRCLKILIPIITISIVVPNGISFVINVTQDNPLVNTPVGQIRGLTSDDGTYSMFLGIPYGVVDKSKPFGVATPQPAFTEVFNAFTDSVSCPQTSPRGVIGYLDCLQLNVYVPNTNNRPLPVLVFIHGGRFMMGSSGINTYEPKFLVRHDVVYVSLHYRLSVYGFMCLHTPEIPGNQGLKDQLMALRWIKNNIRAFGGDDENITIFGDSAGGMSADFQLLYAEEGLFHKVLTQSGTSLSPWSMEEEDVNSPIKIARHLGFETENIDDALTFLIDQEPTRVAEATSRLSMRMSPCVEKPFPNVQSFMPTHPVSTPITKRNIPLISGYNDDERLMSYGNMRDEQFETLTIFERSMELSFVFGDNHDKMHAIARRFYFGDEPISAKLRQQVTDFDSDITFVHPTQRTIGKYLESGGVAYNYVFSYVGGRNLQRVRLNITEGGGASHSDELGYLFDLSIFTNTPTPDDQLIIDRITTLWTNFAKYGDPTPTTTDLLPVKWLPVTADRLNYLNITKNINLSTRPFSQRLTFWDLFYDTNREYVKGYSNVSIA